MQGGPTQLVPAIDHHVACTEYANLPNVTEKQGSWALDGLPRILVVDDEPGILFGMRDLLEDEFVVLTSESPEEALRIVQMETALAVVVSDMRMPTMDGNEFLTKVRARSSATRIICSGYADVESIVRAVNEAHIFAFVPKPWDSVQLRQMIREAVELFRAARP